ncbi:transcriptional regulator [Streptomyces diacarni]|uniref:transcriptional regulator n=1 Tax=Streptomyces diacarni TaxID=2800381 RepID=UPI003404F6BD
MAKDYGLPPNAEENRALVKSRLEEQAAGGGPRETLTVEWRGAPEHLEVIQMPAGSLYYNPATHRVRAQSEHDPKRAELLESDPWSPDSQAYLDHLLQALPSKPTETDPDFNELVESLKEYGQNEPGLITRTGILVNGNTRRAALMHLYGPTHAIRVAVLPSSCGWQDIVAVELSLQLRKEHRRDYSYINRLLAVRDLVEQGTPLGVIAATFRTTADRCKQDQWVLAQIESLRERSKAAGERISMVAFEEQAEKFRELHRAYLKQYASNPEKAELLLENRLAAMLLGIAKTEVRLVEYDFRDRYLSRSLPTNEAPTDASASVTIPGLGRAVKGPSTALSAAKALTDAVLQVKAVTQEGSTASQETTREAQEEFGRLESAMREAISDAVAEARVKKRKQAAPARLANAGRDIEQCVTDLVMSRASRSLDEEAFDDAVTDLRRKLDKLALEAKRTVQHPGDGVTWLLEAFGKAD